LDLKPTVDVNLPTNISDTVMDILESIDGTIDGFSAAAFTSDIVEAIESLKLTFPGNLTDELIQTLNTIEYWDPKNFTNAMINALNDFDPSFEINIPSNFTEDLLGILDSFNAGNFTTSVVDAVKGLSFDPSLEINVPNNVTKELVEILKPFGTANFSDSVFDAIKSFRIDPTIELNVPGNFTNRIIAILETYFPEQVKEELNVTKAVVETVTEVVDQFTFKPTVQLQEALNSFSPTVQVKLDSNLTNEIINKLGSTSIDLNLPQNLTDSLTNKLNSLPENITDIVLNLDPTIAVNLPNDFTEQVTHAMTTVVPGIQLEFSANLTEAFLDKMQDLTLQTELKLPENLTLQFEEALNTFSSVSNELKSTFLQFSTNPNLQISINESTTKQFVSALSQQVPSNISSHVTNILDSWRPQIELQVDSGEAVNSILDRWEPDVTVHPSTFIVVMILLSAASGAAYLYINFFGTEGTSCSNICASLRQSQKQKNTAKKPFTSPIKIVTEGSLTPPKDKSFFVENPINLNQPQQINHQNYFRSFSPKGNKRRHAEDRGVELM